MAELDLDAVRRCHDHVHQRGHDASVEDLWCVVANVPLLLAEVDRLREQLGSERLVHALIEHRDGADKAPRWEDNPVAIKNGWVTEDRCVKCGEKSLEVLGLRAELDAKREGHREQRAAELREAADRIRDFREKRVSFRPGQHSHPYTEGFEQWLRHEADLIEATP